MKTKFMLINIVSGLVVLYLLGGIIYWWLTIPRLPMVVEDAPQIQYETTQEQGLRTLRMNKYGGSEYGNK